MRRVSLCVSVCVAVGAIGAGAGFGQTPFALYNSLTFTGLPQNPAPFTAKAYSAYDFPFTISDDGVWHTVDGIIQYDINSAVAAGAQAIVWDVEKIQSLIFPVGGDPGLDAGLEGLRALYTRTHELGGPNLKVGMYIAGVPGDYWQPRTIAPWSADYQDWLGRYRRLNQRANGKVAPFRECCDFVVVEAYARRTGCPGSAEEASAINDFRTILTGSNLFGTYGVLDVARFLASEKPLENCSGDSIALPTARDTDLPIIPWTSCFIVEGDGPWCGRALSCPYMAMILQCAHDKAQGLGVWEGGHASSYYDHQSWTVPLGVNPDWTAITNGALDVLYGGKMFLLRGLNFSQSGNNKAVVATIIATELQNQVIASHGSCALGNLPDGVTMDYSDLTHSFIVSVNSGQYRVVNPPDARPGPSSCYPVDPVNNGDMPSGATNIAPFVGTWIWSADFYAGGIDDEWLGGWGYSYGTPVPWLQALMGQTCNTPD